MVGRYTLALWGRCSTIQVIPNNRGSLHDRSWLPRLCQPSNTWPSLRNYYNVLPDVTMLDSTVTWKPPKKISVKFIYSRQKIDSSYLDDRWLQTEELGGLEGFPSILPTNLHI